MNEWAIRHPGRGQDCFPLDTHTFRIRFRCARGDFDRVELCYCLNKYRWDSERTVREMKLWGRGRGLDYYQLDVSGADTRLSYIFILHKNRRVLYFSEEGLSKSYDFAHGYYTFFQYPFVHACDVHRVVSWADTAVMYQIFPERFAKGLPESEKGYVNAGWDDTPKPDSFFGGDLKGIEDHLPYLADLGVSCLYLNPVFPARSNHKYNVLDYASVDAQLGGKSAFRSLMKAAHSWGMRVILDGVFNHCSWGWPPFQDCVQKGNSSPYWDWFFIDGDAVDTKAPNYLTFAACPDLPKLNTGNEEVIAYFCKVGADWVRDFGIDGWRLDVMDETSDSFLRAFRRAVKQVNPDALILGESWHDASAWLRGDELDGVMNYGLTKALTDYLAAGTLDAAGMADRLMMLERRTSPASARMMMNLIGSHDTERFLTLLNGDRQKLSLAFAVLFFYVGIPCVYYGDEVGMEGGYDPLCRGGFPWERERQDAALHDTVKRLARLKRSGALKGDLLCVSAEGEVLHIVRRGAELWVNASSQAAAYRDGTHMRSLDACSYAIHDLKGAK